MSCELTKDMLSQDKALSGRAKLHHILPLISCLRPFCTQHPLNTNWLSVVGAFPRQYIHRLFHFFRY